MHEVGWSVVGAELGLWKIQFGCDRHKGDDKGKARRRSVCDGILVVVNNWIGLSRLFVEEESVPRNWFHFNGTRVSSVHLVRHYCCCCSGEWEGVNRKLKFIGSHNYKSFWILI